jgi:hypothetical protein
VTDNIQLSSEHNDHYTPLWILERARYVQNVSQHDLDPATSEHANTLVQAKHIYTIAHNGLLQPWFGNVIENPPGGLVDANCRQIVRGKKGEPGCTQTGACGLPPGHKHPRPMSSAAVFFAKSVHEFETLQMRDALYVGFTLEILASVQGISTRHPLSFPTVTLSQRIRFLDNNFKPQRSPTHSNFLTLVVQAGDPAVGRFREVFSEFGHISGA